MGTHTGITPRAAQIALIRAGGNVRAAARALNVSDSTIRWHLANAPTVRVRVVVETADGDPEIEAAVRDATEDLLARMRLER